MRHLKKFNEEIGDPLWIKCNRFYQEYKRIVDFSTEEGDEPGKSDLLDEIGELCNDIKMSKDDVKYVLDNFNCSFDVDKLLKITYDEWVDENEIDSSLKDLVERILDAAKLDVDAIKESEPDFIGYIGNMIKNWSNR